MQFLTTSFFVSEAAGNATITVTRTGGSGGFTTVDYLVSNGTAKYGLFPAPDSNYGQPSGSTAIPIPNELPVSFVGTLVFDANVFTSTFTIPLLDDGSPGATKTVNIALQDPTGAAAIGSPATAALYIVNANLPGAFQFSMANYQVNAAAGSVTITVERGNPGTPVRVNYSMGGGTAVPGQNYVAVAGTLDFGQGVTSETFTVPIIDHFGDTTNLTAGLFLSNPTGGATLTNPSIAILTITPDLVDRVGPTVQTIRFITNRSGIIEKLVVTFSKALNPTTAVNLVNYGYAVRTAGYDHIFGTKDDLIIPLIAAVYNSNNFSVTLTLGRGIHPPTPFLFTINQSTSVPGAGVGVASVTGSLLDGNYSGIAGTPFSTVLIGKTGGFNAPGVTASETSVVVPRVQLRKRRSERRRVRPGTHSRSLSRRGPQWCGSTAGSVRTARTQKPDSRHSLGYSGIKREGITERNYFGIGDAGTEFEARAIAGRGRECRDAVGIHRAFKVAQLSPPLGDFFDLAEAVEGRSASRAFET